MMFSPASIAVLLCASLFSSTSDAQSSNSDNGLNFVPGVNRPLPDPSLGVCAAETTKLLSSPSISTEFASISRQYQDTRFQDSCTVSTNERLCDFDWSQFESNLPFVCERNGGAYIESSTVFLCRHDSNETLDEDKPFLVYREVNYPDCFAADCNNAEIERQFASTTALISDGLERTNDGYVCTSEYLVEDDYDTPEPVATEAPDGACKNGMIPGMMVVVAGLLVLL
jgi:hypothetical protein